MSSKWKITVELSAESFIALQNMAKEILGRVVSARSFKDLPTTGAMGGGGFSDPHRGYSVICESPVEARVAQLRREADELERSQEAQS